MIKQENDPDQLMPVLQVSDLLQEATFDEIQLHKYLRGKVALSGLPISNIKWYTINGEVVVWMQNGEVVTESNKVRDFYKAVQIAREAL